jgi:hypothetical protein
MVAGQIEDKEWILLEGMRDCGKGAICDMIKNAFEDYVKATNSGNFILMFECHNLLIL